MAKAPMVNHWWHVPLYVTPRGLTTSAIHDGSRPFEIEFDFCVHELHVDLRGSVALEAKSVARFYAMTFAALRELGIDVAIRTKPVEVERARSRSGATRSTRPMTPTTPIASGASCCRLAGCSSSSAVASSATSAACTSSSAAA